MENKTGEELIKEYDGFIEELLELTFKGRFVSESTSDESTLSGKYIELEKLIRERLSKEPLIDRLRNTEFKNYVEERKELTEAQKLEKKKEKRKHIANEILSTEVSYLSMLSTIINNYKKPIESKKTIPPETINAIFSNVESIYLLHKIFMEELEPMVNNYDEESKLSNVFKTFDQSMKVYSEFINNYENSNATLNQFNNDPVFIYLREQSGANIDLRSLLISPVQRIPRYLFFFFCFFKMEQIILFCWMKMICSLICGSDIIHKNVFL